MLNLEPERDALIRACDCWLAGELICEVVLPANFYAQMRWIRLLANSQDEGTFRKAEREFNSLVPAVEPVDAYAAYRQRWEASE